MGADVSVTAPLTGAGVGDAGGDSDDVGRAGDGDASVLFVAPVSEGHDKIFIHLN